MDAPADISYVQTVVSIPVTSILSPKEIKKFLVGYYGERIDISATKERITYIIYYPEIVITNSLEHKHTIRDLYVKVEFGSREDKWKVDYFGGGRGLYSLTEAAVGYGHSHLNRSSYNITSFCVGSRTPIHEWGYSGIRTLEELHLFCEDVENFLRWESLESSPYIRTSEMFTPPTGQARNAALSALKRCTPKVIQKLKFKLQTYHGIMLPVPDIEELEDIPDELDMFTDVTVGGIPILPSMVELFESQESLGTLCTFKGRTIEIHLYQETNIVPMKKVLKPAVEIFKYELGKEIAACFFNSNRHSENIRESLEPHWFLQLQMS